LWRIGGYTDALRDRYELVLVDARGHGDSDKPSEVSAYEMPKHAADVVAVLDELGIEAAFHFGFSLGGGTALVLAARYPERARAIVTMGASPTSAEFADAPATNPAGALEQAKLFETQGMAWLADLLEAEGRPQWASLMRKSEGRSQALQCRSWADPTYDRPLLSDVGAAALMIWGEHELPEPMPTLPASARVLVIPNADHAGALEAVHVVVAAIREFFDDAMPGSDGP
jgi:pimeloyl-ACP methyl ester carboxylesterase